MATLKITGASDDLIEIRGAIVEEWNVYLAQETDTGMIAVSDGTLIRFGYDRDGIWRFIVVANGSSKVTKEEGDAVADRNDVVTLDGDNLVWVAMATKWKVAKAQR